MHLMHSTQRLHSQANSLRFDNPQVPPMLHLTPFNLAQFVPAMAAAFLGSLVEFVETLTIVLAVATVRGWRPARVGAAAAGVLVMLVGVVLQRPLARVPENTLKWAVGILLTAFGTFWLGEGLGADWPGGDLSIFAIASALLIGSLAFVTVARRQL